MTTYSKFYDAFTCVDTLDKPFITDHTDHVPRRAHLPPQRHHPKGGRSPPPSPPSQVHRQEEHVAEDTLKQFKQLVIVTTSRTPIR